MTDVVIHPEQSRRAFLGGLAALGAVLPFTRTARAAAAEADRGWTTNEYPWRTFFTREGRAWDEEAALDAARDAGLTGWEPLGSTPENLTRTIDRLKSRGMTMETLYVNSVLHEPGPAKQSLRQAVALADVAREFGTTIVVTNPTPLGGFGAKQTTGKSDEQLRCQAAALDELGEALRERRLTLAYHTHDPELLFAARELHHMLLNTRPENVAYCLDAHWVYRGSGNSYLALLDITRLYGGRVVEVHLRQSQNGTWTETFGPGDIDYARLWTMLQEVCQAETPPKLVLEQAVEMGSPRTLTAQAAHRQGIEYARTIF